jgi:RNA polymerase sigma-70 factor (ECF subfamily)
MVVGAVSDWHAQRSVKHAGAALGAKHDRLADLPAREDLADRLEEAHDAQLAARAVDAVRSRVRPTTWRAFQLQVVEGKRGTEVARELGLKVNAVYVARHNVTQMLRAVAQSLASGSRP